MLIDSQRGIGDNKRMPRVSKSPKRYCPYCSKDRSIKLFTKHYEICNFCFYFDRAAKLTEPIEVYDENLSKPGTDVPTPIPTKL